ncbi:MAG: hypothetical protein E4H14_13665 [Candidatus Thorarchaeota archaeon]|nr:MAG: hypothetical protein E4H14_13665 [Candidatus Thorarchaeota archaeon]
MNVKHYKSEVNDPKRMVNPIDVIIENCNRLNYVIRYLSQLKPKRVNDYAIALEKRLRDDIKDFQIDHSNLDISELLKDCEYLDRFPELLEVMIQFVFYELKLPKDFRLESEEVEVTLMAWLRSTNIFRYHRVKAIVDIMEREEGIQLWKDMVYRATQDSLKSKDEECHPPIKEITEGWIKEGETGESNFELTVVSYDDHKVALRFDKCPVYDSVKHLEDREIAYLSYCWTGYPEEELNKKARRKKTPQTLYQSDYCVEFYWNNDVHPDAEPPTSEFWNNQAESKVII